MFLLLNNGLSTRFNSVKDCLEKILFLSRFELFQASTVLVNVLNL